MKNLSVIAGMLIGTLIGLFATASDDLGLKIVMISIGIITGATIGGLFARSRKQIGKMPSDHEELLGQGISARDRMRNFWRDKGRPIRFSEPHDMGGNRHTFDQDP